MTRLQSEKLHLMLRGKCVHICAQVRQLMHRCSYPIFPGRFAGRSSGIVHINEPRCNDNDEPLVDSFRNNYEHDYEHVVLSVSTLYFRSLGCLNHLLEIGESVQ